jgi:hypothetical protein
MILGAPPPSNPIGPRWGLQLFVQTTKYFFLFAPSLYDALVGQSTPPKPPTARRRPNRGPAIKVLEGPTRTKPPPLPRKRPTWSPATRQWWASTWRSPMAAEWLEADRYPLERLARLRDEQERRPLKAAELAHMLAIEDRFGLSVRSRRMLGWIVLEGELEEPRRRAPSPNSNVRRLRAVDDREAGE